MTAALVPVSAIVLAGNEERNIEACLASLSGWAGEIFVVDSGSTDRTVEIAGRFTRNVVEHPFVTYSEQRNWSQRELPLANEWVLHIDADERVTPELAASIRRLFEAGPPVEVNGALMSRRTVFMGRWIRHGGHYPVYHCRLFRRDRGACEDRLYDQHFVVDPPTVRLDGDLIDVITSDLGTWVERHARWGALEAAEQLHDRAGARRQVRPRIAGSPVERRRWLRSSVYGRAPRFLRAFLYFLYRYVVRLGFLDGVQGLIFHFMQGCWYRFYVDAKLWEIERQRMPAEGSRAEKADKG